MLLAVNETRRGEAGRGEAGRDEAGRVWKLHLM